MYCFSHVACIQKPIRYFYTDLLNQRRGPPLLYPTLSFALNKVQILGMMGSETAFWFVYVGGVRGNKLKQMLQKREGKSASGG